MKSMKSRAWPIVVMVSVLVIGLGTLVGAYPERTQGAESWPFGVEIPGEGKKAIKVLEAIHVKAMDALPGATAQDRPRIRKVLLAVFKCVAHDGTAPVPDPAKPPAHAPGHAGAAGKVRTAWKALNKPADPQHPNVWADWGECASNLEHGHDED